MSEKTLIIVRHGHRDKSEGKEKDNGLSAKGKAQAERIAQYFRQAHPKAIPLILSSPKKRCLETVEPLAKILGLKVEISDLLDEQNEGGRSFVARIQKFLAWWEKQGPQVTVAASHGDWIPICLELATGAAVDLKKAGWAEIGLDEGSLKLKWVLQDVGSGG